MAAKWRYRLNQVTVEAGSTVLLYTCTCIHVYTCISKLLLILLWILHTTYQTIKFYRRPYTIVLWPYKQGVVPE